MAEKEERIWIDYPLPKNTGATEARRCTTMTRQEAIERMAKAMAADDTLVEGYYEMAEKALNALLEG